MTLKKGTDQELSDAYLIERLTTPEIAKKFGFSSHACVDRRLRSMGIPIRQSPLEDVSLTPRQISILEGTLLGDATAYITSSMKGVIRVSHTAQQEDFTLWMQKELQPFSCKVVKPYFNHSGNRVVEFCTHTLLKFAEYRKRFYPDGVKIVPKDLRLDPLGLAVLLMDDGYYTVDRAVLISSCGFSEEDNQFLREYLQTTFNLKATLVWVSGHRYRKIRISAKSYLDLVDLVRPHLLPTMLYKIGC